MSDKLSKILKIFVAILLLISTIATFLFYKGLSGLSAEATFSEQIEYLGGTLEFFLQWTYILVAIAAIAAIVFPAVSIIANPKQGLKSILSIVALLLLFGVSYAISSDTIVTFIGWEELYAGMYPQAKNLEELKVNAQELSLQVGTGLIATYILSVLAIVSVIGGEIFRALR